MRGGRRGEESSLSNLSCIGNRPGGDRLCM